MDQQWDITVLKEFLPWLVSKTMADSMEKESCLLVPATWLPYPEPRFRGPRSPWPTTDPRWKEEDFVVVRCPSSTSTRPHTLKPGVVSPLAPLLVIDIRRSLDEKLFEDAEAAAHRLRQAIPGTRYILLCEWPDWTPSTHASTITEEVIVLRPTREVSSPHADRSPFQKRLQEARRMGRRERYARCLEEQPFLEEAFSRFLSHLSDSLREGKTVPDQE